MTDQRGGGRPPPTDDRTLLDPLNPDELKALREARQKMKGKAGGAVAHHAVIGPDAGEDIGDAPTRAMPALPQFENPGASLDRIPTGEMKSPARHPHGTPPPVIVARPAPPDPARAGRPGAGPSHGPGGGPPTAGQGGFGENTLMWMAPPKAPPPSSSTGVLSAAELQRAKAAQQKRTMKAVAGAAVLVLIIGSLAYAFRAQPRAVIDLHTNPPKATVKINGKPTPNTTPMKLNLVEGTYEIEIDLAGYKSNVFTVKVDPGQQPSRRDVELEPISKAGLVTVAVAVQPVASNITLDGTVYSSKRTLNIPNLDPNVPHKITIEAGGYVKVDQEIPAGQLKKNYTFFLQQDEANKPK